MTRFNPFIKLTRLIVFTSSGKIAYDEQFHNGVNIIRGHNSSGKSTISNFIFYVLGGDFNKWTTAALECTSVVAEVEFNGSKLTLRRDINVKIHQPMSIFWDSIDKALNSSFENWEIYPYRSSDNKSSFSNVLFTALGFPELKGDVDSNISMHQILRLIYIDQKSLTENLILTEQFDSPLTRRTIADLLLGVYDDSLYSNKLALRQSRKDFEINKSQLEGILNIFSSTGNEINPEEFKSFIDNNILQLEKINESLIVLGNNRIPNEEPSNQPKVRTLQENLISKKQELSKVIDRINEYELEVADSIEFIQSLERRINALEDSITTRENLESLRITHCPSCLSLIIPGDDHNNCYLCKKPLSKDDEKSQINRMQQELHNQIRESKNLLKQKEQILQDAKTSYPALERKAKILQVELHSFIKTAIPPVSEFAQSLLLNKGRITSENEFYLKQLKAVEKLEILRKELDRLKLSIERLETSIQAQESNQQNRLNAAMGKIKEIAVYLLHNDLDRQPEFKVA